MQNMTTVYAVDDDPTTLTLLRALLADADVQVETYESAESFLLAYSPERPGCLLLDVVMPGMDGLELQRTLDELGSDIPIIFLSGTAEVRTAVRALKAGAIDFIEKPLNATRIKRCVQYAVQLDLERRYVKSRRCEAELKRRLLTRREREVMDWMVKGKSNKEIARILGISSRTVEVHRGRVMEKMEARNVLELVDRTAPLDDVRHLAYA
tara:strand:+ start:6654 stop:7283 length:630 start_codon:yes stop_codon:yes gene_type:complete